MYFTRRDWSPVQAYCFVAAVVISIIESSVAFLPKTHLLNVCRVNDFQRTYFCSINNWLKSRDDDTMVDELQRIEYLSPSRKTNQKVACLISSGNVVLIRATNSFLRHVGVHAEMNAISQYLNIFPAPSGPFNIAVTYSPCVECAQLICMIKEIREVYFRFEYYDGGLQLLKESGVIYNELEMTEKERRPKNVKLHSYNKLAWDSNVTSIMLTRNLDGIVVLSHNASCAFDIRPFVIFALRSRNSDRELLHLSYCGNLNHRESLFLEVTGVQSSSISTDEFYHSAAVTIHATDVTPFSHG